MTDKENMVNNFVLRLRNLGVELKDPDTYGNGDEGKDLTDEEIKELRDQMMRVNKDKLGVINYALLRAKKNKVDEVV